MNFAKNVGLEMCLLFVQLRRRGRIEWLLAQNRGKGLLKTFRSGGGFICESTKKRVGVGTTKAFVWPFSTVCPPIFNSGYSHRKES